MDWIDRSLIINKKITKMYKVLKKDIFTVGTCIATDYECSKALLSISHRDWKKILNKLYKANEEKLAYKVEAILCYINELERLAQVNVKELIGLTRDDVAKMQKVCVLNKGATGVKSRNKVIETLTKLVDIAADAEFNDERLEKKADEL